MLLCDRETTWKVWYLVMDGDIHLDAEAETGLSKTEIKTALTTVDVTLGSLVLTADAVLYDYRMRFVVTLTTEVLVVDFTKFISVLDKVWEAQMTGEDIYIPKTCYNQLLSFQDMLYLLIELRRFSLRSIHSHSDTTGVFCNAFFGNCRVADFRQPC